MSDPIISPSDLMTYLGQENLPEDRLTFIIEQAQALCESVVSPLPDGASAVVIDVVCRAYANPMNASQQTDGPFSATMPGGLYLTKANERTLRRLAGSGGAFSIDLLSGYTAPCLPWYDNSTGISLL